MTDWYDSIFNWYEKTRKNLYWWAYNNRMSIKSWIRRTYLAIEIIGGLTSILYLLTMRMPWPLRLKIYAYINALFIVSTYTIQCITEVREKWNKT